MKQLNDIPKAAIRHIGEINGGVLGIIFLCILLYFAAKDLSDFSGITWSFVALGFALFVGSFIWGLTKFRSLKVHFKTDIKSKRIFHIESLLNVLGIIVMEVGAFVIFYYENRAIINHEGYTVSFSFHPFFLQGLTLFIVGAITLGLTTHLYNRFIPEQIIR